MIADLRGKTALVTGAGGGIGSAIARALAEQGATVALTDVRLDAVKRAAETIGGAATMTLELDVTSRESAVRAFSEAEARLGQIDILVNNAGGGWTPRGGGEEESEEAWAFTLELNLRGTIRCSEIAARGMRERRSGRIVNIASISGHGSRGTHGPYPVAKAGVLRYTRGLAVQLAPFGITVNAVCPGALWTGLQQPGFSALAEGTGRDPYDVFLESYAGVIPLGRPQEPEEIGKAVAYLASDDARSITGQCLHVDGGAVMRD